MVFSKEAFSPEFIDADFMVRCIDDGMENARILKGDIVYIKQGAELQNGDLVAARVWGEVVLRKVFFYPNDKVVLRACNPLYCDLTFSPADNLNILGKAVAFTSSLNTLNRSADYPEENKLHSGLLSEE